MNLEDDIRRLRDRVGVLEGHVGSLERALIDEQERHDALKAAVSDGRICDHLGHNYQLPSYMLRQRIQAGNGGWKLPRVCTRCAHEDGAVWAPHHWTVVELVA